MLLVWDTRDNAVPRECLAADQKATSRAKGTTSADVRYHPENEHEEELSRAGNKGPS